MELEELCPSDERLIDGYLRPKIAGKGVGGDYVRDADVYSDHPCSLVRKHKPAVVTGDGHGRIWYFFSPTRYVGGKNAPRHRGWSRQRSWTVAGADGRKKGTWNAGKTKYVMDGSAGGYFRKLTYQKTTPSGVIKTGWMMIEYGVAEEHGGGDIVLCKVYKSGNGSEVSSVRKRKDDAVQHPDEDRTRARQHQQQQTATEDDDTMLFAQSLETDLQKTSQDDDAMTFAQSLESELICYFETENLPSQQGPPAAADDDDVMEISLDEFLGSSAARAAPPCTAQPESATASCIQTPSQQDESTDDDDDMMCELACPAMDEAYVELILSESEPLVQFDLAFLEEFISDL